MSRFLQGEGADANIPNDETRDLTESRMKRRGCSLVKKNGEIMGEMVRYKVDEGHNSCSN
jgi:hypothetical protein